MPHLPISAILSLYGIIVMGAHIIVVVILAIAAVQVGQKVRRYKVVLQHALIIVGRCIGRVATCIIIPTGIVIARLVLLLLLQQTMYLEPIRAPTIARSTFRHSDQQALAQTTSLA